MSRVAARLMTPKGTSGLVLAIAAFCAACGTAPSTGAAARPVRAATTTTTSTTVPTTTTVDPGTLPQTEDEPSNSDPAFLDRVLGLWSAIVNDQPSLGMPFFFPESAYLQTKSISNPAEDYQNRLIAAYDHDIHQAHLQLGAAAPSAALAGITVPPTVHWTPPGREYNKIGYWQVFDPIIHYQEGATTVSFTVYSLISWRGEWYIVHFGPPT